MTIATYNLHCGGNRGRRDHVRLLDIDETELPNLEGTGIQSRAC